MTSEEDKYKNSGGSPIKIHNANLKKACELETEKAYLNNIERLQMLFLPNCTNEKNCKHATKNILQSQQISLRASNTIRIEMAAKMWHEALEISFLSITPKQYLTESILRDIVEIMLNAHEDRSSKYSITHIISRCEQVLALHFRMHPPCNLDCDIYNIYKSFLMDPMTSTQNDKKHSTMKDYSCDKGIIQYCFNRLEYEISSESKDGPLVDKDKTIPENIRDTIKGRHYEKEYLKLYELLDRPDRIDRLMAVLRSIIELLQFNFFIIKSRQARQNFLMYDLFFPKIFNKAPKENFSKVPKISVQIMKLFAYFVHLDYTPEYVKILQIWLNMAIEIQFYKDCFSHWEYSNLGLYGNDFADKFYTIISVLPHESIIKILTQIHPAYMKRVVGLHYSNNCLKYEEKNIINILIKFLKSSKWNDYPDTVSVNLPKNLDIVEVTSNNIIEQLSKICKTTTDVFKNPINYPKYHSNGESNINLDIVISALYISLKAFLDSYSVQNVNETLKKIDRSENVPVSRGSQYSVISYPITVYIHMYQCLPTITSILKELQKNNKLPEKLKIFENLLINYNLFYI